MWPLTNMTCDWICGIYASASHSVVFSFHSMALNHMTCTSSTLLWLEHCFNQWQPRWCPVQQKVQTYTGLAHFCVNPTCCYCQCNASYSLTANTASAHMRGKSLICRPLNLCLLQYSVFNMQTSTSTCSLDLCFRNLRDVFLHRSGISCSICALHQMKGLPE